LATELMAAGFLDDCGWAAGGVRHVRETLRLPRPLAEAGAWLVDGEVTGVQDLGASEGAGIDVELRARRQRDDEPVAILQRRYLAASDGGFGGPRPAAALPPLPTRPPDLSDTVVVAPAQTLWYAVGRPRTESAPAAGGRPGSRSGGPTQLPPPAVFGLAGLAVLRVICEFDHTLMTSLAADLTGSAESGETLVTDLWQDANLVRFRVRAPARNSVLVDRGSCVLAT
jgi:hypothetical protein